MTQWKTFINIFITHKMAAKASWHRNYVTVTLCIEWRAAFPMTFEWHFKIRFFFVQYVIMHSTTVDGVCASRGPSATVQLLLTPYTFRYTTCYDLRTSLCPRVYLRNYTSRLCTVTYGCGLASIWRALWCVMYFRFYGLTSYLHSADVSRLLSACKCNVSEIPVSEVCRIVDIVCSEWRHLSSYATAD